MNTRSINFPDWKLALAQTTFTPQEKSQYTEEIITFLRLCKVQQAAARSVELATVSGLVNNLQTTMQADGASAAGVASGNVTVDIWLECNGVRQADVNGTCSASAPARFASTTITDTYTPLFAAFFSGTGAAADNTLSVPLLGYASVRVQ